eukprot:4632300-Pleurochrysis_carterae.AAC.6
MQLGALDAGRLEVVARAEPRPLLVEPCDARVHLFGSLVLKGARALSLGATALRAALAAAAQLLEVSLALDLRRPRRRARQTHVRDRRHLWCAQPRSSRRDASKRACVQTRLSKCACQQLHTLKRSCARTRQHSVRPVVAVARVASHLRARKNLNAGTPSCGSNKDIHAGALVLW